MSSVDAVPHLSFQYGLSPLVLADVVVFPGLKGVYAMPRVVNSGGAGGASGGGTATATTPTPSSDSDSDSDSGSSAGGSGAAGGTWTSAQLHARGAQWAASLQLGRAVPRSRLAQDAMPALSSSSAAVAAAPPPPPSYKLLYSYRLPAGVVMEPWDWLDLKSGSVLLKASPYQLLSGQRLQAMHHNHPGHHSINNNNNKDDDGGRIGDGMSLRRPNSAGISGVGEGESGDVKAGGVEKRVVTPQSWVFSLDPLNGTLRWSTGFDASVGPMYVQPLSHDWGRGGLMLADVCAPASADDGPGGSGSNDDWMSAARISGGLPMLQEGGSGMVCTLYAVSLADGSVAWAQTFDLDRACASALRRRTATYIVYGLLAAQGVVMLMGCVLGVYWSRATRRATIMEDPDSEDEGLIVQVLPHGAGHHHQRSCDKLSCWGMGQTCSAAVGWPG